MSSCRARAAHLCLALSVLLSSACGGDALDSEKSAALGSPIQVRDEQSGVVGVTGTVWTIDPDGFYRTERFVNDALTLDREGRLTEEQMHLLAETLSSAGLADLPSKLGPTTPPANPRRIVIESGGRRSELVLRGGESLGEARAAAGGAEAPEHRLLAVVEAVGSLVGTGAD